MHLQLSVTLELPKIKSTAARRLNIGAWTDEVAQARGRIVAAIGGVQEQDAGKTRLAAAPDVLVTGGALASKDGLRTADADNCEESST
jgi:hypothetical protein